MYDINKIKPSPLAPLPQESRAVSRIGKRESK
jgi:hypothetical protein